METIRKRCVEPLHPSREIRGGRFQTVVVVVGGQTRSMDDPAGSLTDRQECLFKNSLDF
jgi:hypothetical protein